MSLSKAIINDTKKYWSLSLFDPLNAFSPALKIFGVVPVGSRRGLCTSQTEKEKYLTSLGSSN